MQVSAITQRTSALHVRVCRLHAGDQSASPVDSKGSRLHHAATPESKCRNIYAIPAVYALRCRQFSNLSSDQAVIISWSLPLSKLAARHFSHRAVCKLCVADRPRTFKDTGRSTLARDRPTLFRAPAVPGWPVEFGACRACSGLLQHLPTQHSSSANPQLRDKLCIAACTR